MQAIEDVHDTELMRVQVLGVGAAGRAQENFVSVSTNGFVNPVVSEKYSPTAVQARGDRHDTPFNPACVLSPELGRTARDQPDPFQVSTKASRRPPSWTEPAAAQKLDETQETDRNLG